MRRAVSRIVLLPILLAAPAALAGEDSDLDLIPDAARAETPAAPAAKGETTSSVRDWNVKLENATALTAIRAQTAAPIPGADPARVENRLSLDARGKVRLSDSVALNLSNRLSLNTSDAADGTRVRHDFREGYVGWDSSDGFRVEAGRVNVKNGMATGFNPTDWFRSGSKVATSSADPSAVREGRLGTLMLRAQTVWDGGSASLAYAPKVGSRPDLTKRVGDWSPAMERTNHEDRVVGTLGFDIGDLTLQGAAMWRAEGSRFGFNASRPFSDSVVGYVEWSGGWGRSLIDAGEDWGRKTGLIPPPAPDILDPGSKSRFLNDLAAGFSWTSEYKVTVYAEYHFHEAGMSGAEWKRWFDRARAGDAPSLGALWNIRSYAEFEQDPATRHRGFVRVSWSDAFTPKLELSGFTTFNLSDGSGTAQIEANYPITDAWNVIGTASTTYGGPRTEFGILSGAAGGILRIVRYF